MTVLIDPPLWPAHGRRWSHLVSDESLAELHAFARRLGVPERGFEGDHYDLPEERYADAVAAGAVPVGSRELLRRLQGSGLRRPKRRGERVLASTHPRDGVRVDTVESSREPAAPVDVVIVAVRWAGALLVLPDGEGLLLPQAPVREPAADGVQRASAALLGELLGHARPSGPGTQLGYLRTVSTAPAGTPTPGGVAAVWGWSIAPAGSPSGRLAPASGALWRPAPDAVARLPVGLSALLRD